MVLWLASQVLEQAMLPVSLHVIPIFNLAMSNRIVDLIGLAVGQCFVTNVKVEVLDALL